MVPTEEQPLKDTEDKNVKKKKTFKEKITYIKENITVEPILACYVIPGALARLATQNLNLDKACRVNKNYGATVCDALIARQGNKYLEEELSVQELIAAMESWKNVLLTAIPSFLILFLGAWSDRTGKRKICILLPIFGDLLMCLSNILNAYYFYELPVEITMFFEAFFPAITGGWITIYMGAFAYISDASSEESRTFRVGIANLCLTAGGPIGSVLSGVLLKHIGYYGVFSLSSLLYIISIVYGFYCIDDPKRPEKAKVGTHLLSDMRDGTTTIDETNMLNSTSKTSVKEPSNDRGFLRSFFDIKHVKDTITVVIKKGPNHRRAKSILILASIALIHGPAYGEYNVCYLFTRNRFNWDALKYSFYNTFYFFNHSLGAIISISLFSYRLKWDDAVLGLISNISKVIGALTTNFARNSMEMYIAVALEMFNATSSTALRSIVSKLCRSDELGKMTSIFNLVEVLASMVFVPIYSWTYRLTLKFDAGFIYYLSTVLTIPNLAIFGWFYMQNKKGNLKSDATDEEEKRESNEIKHRNSEYLLSSIDMADEMTL